MKKLIERVNKQDTNNRSKEEEIQNLKKTSRFYIKS